MRVHTLAKELNVTSKVVLDKCQAEGLPIKNHMSTLSAGQEATIREWFSEGEHTKTLETTGRVDLDKARVRRRKHAAADEHAEGPLDEVALEGAEAVVPTGAGGGRGAGADACRTVVSGCTPARSRRR